MGSDGLIKWIIFIRQVTGFCVLTDDFGNSWVITMGEAGEKVMSHVKAKAAIEIVNHLAVSAEIFGYGKLVTKPGVMDLPVCIRFREGGLLIYMSG